LTQDVAHSFRIALIIKCYLKSYVSTDKSSEGKTSTYGARIAIGIGDMRIVDREHDLMDGEAIYLSGRALSALGDATKGSLTVATGDASLTEALQTVAMLTDVLVNNLTQRQSEVILYKLLGENEQSIADTLNITQAAVNTHASRAKWYSIKQAVNYFEQINFTEHES
jgi:DNA-binding NarL/FixJ family response regulator